MSLSEMGFERAKFLYKRECHKGTEQYQQTY